MGDIDFQNELAQFDRAAGESASPQAAWKALEDLAVAVAGARLFTVMTVDMQYQLARRAYSSHPVEYPVSGVKPIRRDVWFETVHERRELFAANTLAEIARVFPDYETIASLGCGSVVNLPVVLTGKLAATVNLLHEENHYGPERLEAIRRHLPLPAKTSCLLAMALERASVGFDLASKNAG